MAKYHVIVTAVYQDGGEEKPIIYGPFSTEGQANALMQKLFDEVMDEDDGTYDGDDTDPEKFTITDSISATTYWIVDYSGL